MNVHFFVRKSSSLSLSLVILVKRKNTLTEYPQKREIQDNIYM